MRNSIIVIVLILFSNTLAAQRKHILFDVNFAEHASFTKFPSREIYNDNSQLISDSVKKNGKKSVRVEIKLANILGDKGIRSEFAFLPEANPERWYGLSIFAPPNYLPDPEPEIVTQWHNTPDLNLGEG